MRSTAVKACLWPVLGRSGGPAGAAAVTAAVALVGIASLDTASEAEVEGSLARTSTTIVLQKNTSSEPPRATKRRCGAVQEWAEAITRRLNQLVSLADQALIIPEVPPVAGPLRGGLKAARMEEVEAIRLAPGRLSGSSPFRFKLLVFLWRFYRG